MKHLQKRMSEARRRQCGGDKVELSLIRSPDSSSNCKKGETDY